MRLAACTILIAGLVLAAFGSVGGQWAPTRYSYTYRAKTSLSGTLWSDPRTPWYLKVYGDIRYGEQWGIDPYPTMRYYGLARFDLSRIPDSATVTSADFCMYQYWSYGDPVDRVELLVDITAPAESLGWGSSISDPCTCYGGWDMIPLYDLGCAAIESCLAQGYVDMRLTGPTFEQGVSYGYSRPSDLKAYLLISFTSTVGFCDIAALDAHLSTFPCRSSEAETVSFRVACQGESSPGSVTAYLDLDGTTVDSQALGEVHVGETLTAHLRFLAPAQEKKLQLSCFTKAPNDSLSDNDTASFDCWCFPVYATAAVDFEPEHFPSFPPSGWVLRGTSPQWTVNPIIDLGAHIGRRYASNDGGDSTRSTWLITSALYPSLATADSVGLFLRSNGSYDEVQVFALSAQDTSAQSGLLLNDSLDQTWREYRASLDAFDRLPIYVGIRRSNFVGYGVRLDDVWFSCPIVPAIADGSDSCAFRHDVLPTIAGGVLILPEATDGEQSVVRSQLLDITGRKVMDLRLGANDVRALAPGVYFVCERGERSEQGGAGIRKVVVTK